MRSLYRESESRPQTEVKKPKNTCLKARRAIATAIGNAVLTIVGIMVIPLVAWDLRRKL